MPPTRPRPFKLLSLRICIRLARCACPCRCVFAIRVTDGTCYLKDAPFGSINGRSGVNMGVETTCWLRANVGAYYCKPDYDVYGTHVGDAAALTAAACTPSPVPTLGDCAAR